MKIFKMFVGCVALLVTEVCAARVMAPSTRSINIYKLVVVAPNTTLSNRALHLKGHTLGVFPSRYHDHAYQFYPLSISDDTHHELQRYPFPGNVAVTIKNGSETGMLANKLLLPSGVNPAGYDLFKFVIERRNGKLLLKYDSAGDGVIGVGRNAWIVGAEDDGDGWHFTWANAPMDATVDLQLIKVGY